ncbi:MAG: TIGR01777 family oxidoreductase [Gemmatimonadetes bacterium]|nr:TIGR01777 family oxidoreductase [Gemmatimonadota bacterium]MCB9517849.1 TIGR01777 family protein [Gemmatimonadales bacterium]HPF62693.1 TIGR01777 family oxidoreductase [Gemmatimonadales bacterium]
MTEILVERTSILPAPIAAAWAWHTREGAFERLTPPWERVEVIARDPRGLVDGAEVSLRVRVGPLSLTWVARHSVPHPGRGFDDTQVRGPFASFHHARRLESASAGETILSESIRAVPPLGPLGALGAPGIRSVLERMLRWRHDILHEDLGLLMATPAAPMRIAITGATGLVGRALAPFLTTQGHTVVPVSRRALPGGIRWDPSSGDLDAAAWEGLDAVIHLAGENIAGERWSAERKRALRDSRTGPTALLARTLATLERPPRVLLSASAVGIYGDRGDALLDEDASPAGDFLGELARDWEAAAEPARAAGIRVVHPRFGLILTPAGGVLDRMLTPFRLGVGGRLGSGTQWMSWVAIDDVLGALHHALVTDGITGPMNVVAPDAVRNTEFTATLGAVLSRPTILPVPAIALRAVFGEMADALLLASQRAEPSVLTATGYSFRYPELDVALRHLLGR